QGAPLARRRGDALTTAQLVDALDAEWRATAA
ncbi:2-nitropropane dioxygenase, NPD, partial [Burkholderia sp. TJI49]